MFDPKKPTVLLLGRWQPWHDGHIALFQRAIAKTGQVIIQVRDVKDSSGGEGQDDNPFSFEEISNDIENRINEMIDGEKVILSTPVEYINLTFSQKEFYAVQDLVEQAKFSLEIEKHFSLN